MVHIAPFQAYFFLSECVQSVAARTQSGHLTDTEFSGTGTANPAQPQKISEAMLDQYVKAAAKLP
jgi:hypothetical protein